MSHMMYETEIRLVNGSIIRGFINDYGLNQIKPLITKKRFWRNKVIEFEMYEREKKTSYNTGWKYKFTAVLRNKNIILFTYKIVSYDEVQN